MPSEGCFPCPRCGAGGTRQGTKPRRAVEVDAVGRAVAGEAFVQRWRCTGCGGFYTTGFDAAGPRSMMSAAARDAVAVSCFSAGFAPAGAAAGIDEKTAKAMWERWAAPRESEIPSRPPVMMGLHPVTVAGVERTLVTDAASLAVVDVLAGTTPAHLDAWLAGRGYRERVDTVAVAFHPALRSSARGNVPDARVLVCPGHARAAGMSSFLGAFRRMKVRLGSGALRNVKEAPRTFATPSGDLRPHELEEMDAWDAGFVDLYRAKERFMEAFGADGPRSASAVFVDVVRMCAGMPQIISPATLLETWGNEFAAGVGIPGLDPFERSLARLSEAWESRRPMLPFDLARGMAVLADLPRLDVEGEDGLPIRVGVPMNDVSFAFGASAQ